VATKLLEVEMPTGETIWAYISTPGPSDVKLSSAIPQLDVDDLRKTVNAVSHSVCAALESVRPDDVSVEFGLELTIRSGRLIGALAEAGGAASLRLTLSWHGRSPAGAPDPATA
jgi:hypothetical protein